MEPEISINQNNKKYAFSLHHDNNSSFIIRIINKGNNTCYEAINNFLLLSYSDFIYSCFLRKAKDFVSMMINAIRQGEIAIVEEETMMQLRCRSKIQASDCLINHTFTLELKRRDPQVFIIN